MTPKPILLLAASFFFLFVFASSLYCSIYARWLYWKEKWFSFLWICKFFVCLYFTRPTAVAHDWRSWKVWVYILRFPKFPQGVRAVFCRHVEIAFARKEDGSLAHYVLRIVFDSVLTGKLPRTAPYSLRGSYSSLFFSSTSRRFRGVEKCRLSVSCRLTTSRCIKI